MLHSLWHTPSKWISDPHNYVFLPRAILEIGKALYLNEWSGAEPATPVFLPLPLRSADAPEWQKREAHIALCKKRPDFGRKPLDALPHHSHISLGGFSKGPPIIPCVAVDCALWPFRMGANPFRSKRELTPEQKRERVERLTQAHTPAAE